MNYFTAITYVISHIFLMLFIYLFILHRYSRITTILSCLFSFLAISILDGFKLIFFPESRLCYVIVTLLQITLTQSTAIFNSKYKSSQALFVGLSASSYVIAGAISAAIIKIYSESSILALIGSSAIHLGIILFLSKYLRKICLEFQEKSYNKGWWELCLIPVFFYCSFSFIGFFPHTLYENPDNIPGTIFIAITMFVSYIVVLRYLNSEAKRSSIYWEHMLQQSYIQGLENRHYLVEQAEQNLKILHHDIRHYSKLIDSLLEQKKYDEIKSVNEHISHMADENKVEAYCANLLVNTILTNMMAKALSLDIKVILDARVPKELPVNDYELTLVVANLFENALQCVKEFEKEKRELELNIHCSHNQLFIESKNRYEGEILLDPITNLPKSKKNGNHGLGMQSILAFSKKVNGTIGCYLDHGIFHMMMTAKF
ncbi:MAG: GHKL domain-containing protein [Lachnospiraceae bacterium]|nr:GHKL domain-containing protein [Lachnospiraceae bacterium]